MVRISNFGQDTESRMLALFRKLDPDLDLMACGRKFHGLTRAQQKARFTGPLIRVLDGIPGESISQAVQKAINLPSELPPITNDFAKKPIVVGTKDGVDIEPVFIVQHGNLELDSLDIKEGGVSTSTANGFRLSGLDVEFPNIVGSGAISDAYLALLNHHGISCTRIVDEKRDSNIHPCFIFRNGKKQVDEWFVNKSFPFSQRSIKELRTKVFEACRANPGQALVLSKIPPCGAGDDFFFELAEYANKQDDPNPVVYNLKHYDKYDEVLKALVKAKVALIKPNIIEFVQVLRYSGVIKNSGNAEKCFIKKLTTQIKKEDFKETIELARELMKQCHGNIEAILLSVGEHPSLLILPEKAYFAKPPKITLASPTCAGDSGLAAFISHLHSKGVSLNDLKDVSPTLLESALRRFVTRGALTAAKPGSEQSTLAEASSYLRHHAVYCDEISI